MGMCRYIPCESNKAKGALSMDNISNKTQQLQKFGLQLDVTKSKDVLGKDSVKVRDVLNGGKDKKIDQMSDVFPRINNGDIDDLLS